MVLKHELATEECKNLNVTRALLSFKIKMPDGTLETKRMEVSMDELRTIRQELKRIEETLAWSQFKINLQKNE